MGGLQENSLSSLIRNPKIWPVVKEPQFLQERPRQGATTRAVLPQNQKNFATVSGHHSVFREEGAGIPAAHCPPLRGDGGGTEGKLGGGPEIQCGITYGTHKLCSL